MSIAENVAAIRQRINDATFSCGRDPKDILLCAATKMNDASAVRQAIAAGVDCCGENRVQELTAHLAAHAYDGAQVHFIGHLQTNKVRYVVGKVDLIHSVSSEKLLLAIDKQAEKLNIVQDILLEVNLAGEASKSGFSPETVLAGARLAADLDHIRLRGLMCIPPISTKPGQNRPFFANLRRLAVDIRQQMEDNKADIVCLSMGMSGDYSDAVAEGATFVRLGTALFGPRPSIHPAGES